MYEAQNIWSGQRVALKLPLRESPTGPPRSGPIAHEARVLSRLVHPNIVRVLDVVIDRDKGSCLVQELLLGQRFDEILTAGVSAREALGHLLPVMDALTHVHDHGFVHCDVKPENIVLCRSPGERLVPKLMDFGIAQRMGTPVETPAHPSARIAGTPHYMAPEQLGAGPAVDERTDIWAMGVVLYEALTGAPPFDGRTLAEVFDRVKHFDPPPPSTHVPAVPAAIDAAVVRALSRSPERRWASMRELAAALAPAAAGLAETSRSASVETLPAPPMTPDSTEPDVRSGGATSPRAETLPPPDASGLLRFGLVPTMSDARLTALSAALRVALRRRCSVVRYFSYAELVSALEEERVDLAWMSPVAYVRAQKRGAAQRLFTLERHARTTYSSALLGRGIASLSDVIGKRAVWVDPWSAAGYLMPRHLLRIHGFPPEEVLASEGFAGSYEVALDALREGTADLTGSFCTLTEDGGVATGPWPDGLDVLAVSSPIPGDTVCARATLDASQIRELADGLGDAERADPIARLLGATRLVRGADDLYGPLARALEDGTYGPGSEW